MHERINRSSADDALTIEAVIGDGQGAKVDKHQQVHRYGVNLFGEGIDFDVVYKADVISVLSGGLQRTTTALGNLDLKLTVDAEKLFGWQGARFFLYGLADHGGKPNAHNVGSAQGIDNIEVSTNTAKLYQAWVEKNFWEGRASVLVGLYDLNSEFYVSDTASLFLNPSPGIGPDFQRSTSGVIKKHEV